MAIDLASYKIRANAVAPGFIHSDALATAESAAGATAIQAIRNFVPSRRFAEQNEVASAALFFAGDASSYCTGSVLTVDGGLTLGIVPTSS